MRVNTNLDAMKSGYAKQKRLLKEVLASPKAYFYDVRALIRSNWDLERKIIRASGTIYNGL